MECYEKTYPAWPVKVILAGTRAEFKDIGTLLADYVALTKKNKTVERYREQFESASEQALPLVLFSQKEAQQLYVYMKNYSDLKKKVKNHRVHKLIDAFDDGWDIW